VNRPPIGKRGGQIDMSAHKIAHGGATAAAEKNKKKRNEKTADKLTS
jgi:hypothetical protein